VVYPGTPLRLGEESVDDPGWIRATAPNGRSAWVPEAYVQGGGGNALALREYSSRELRARAGEEVALLLELCGWVWVRASNGEEGWLPVKKLARG